MRDFIDLHSPLLGLSLSHINASLSSREIQGHVREEEECAFDGRYQLARKNEAEP